MKTFADFGIDVPAGGSGNVYTTCPQCSASRRKQNAKCLNVQVDQGIWVCMHCDWRGGLGGGIEKRAQPAWWKPQVYRRPEYQPSPPPASLKTWFDRRHISEDVVERFKLGLDEVWMPAEEEMILAVQFPYYRGEECVNVKSRGYHVKTFRQVADAEKIFYNLPAIAGSKVAVICEGEVDVLSFATAGIPYAISVPDGAPPPNSKPSEKKFDFLVNCEQELAGLEKIILATDHDPAGMHLADELARRLGPERCWRVEWPAGVKDANQLLCEYGLSDLLLLVDGAKPMPIEGIFKPSDIAEKMFLLYMFPERECGVSTGWVSVDQFWHVKPGDMTIVTGIPSHGKSEWVDALLVNLMRDHEWPAALCSPENRPIEEHLAKLIEKQSGQPFRPGPTPRMDQKTMAMGVEYFEPLLTFISTEDAMTVGEVLAKAKALVFRQGLKLLVIDPWNEFDHRRTAGLTETEYISRTLSDIRRFARLYQVHVIVVAHPQKLQRKEDGTYPVPSPYDISGSANWYNKPDNVLCIWRDKGNPGAAVQLHIQKVRWKYVGQTGQVPLHWLKVSGRYEDWQPDEGGKSDCVN